MIAKRYFWGRIGLLLLAWGLLFGAQAQQAQAFDRVFVQAYASQLVNMDLGNFLYDQKQLGKMKGGFMVTGGIGAESFVWKKHLAFGVEGNASYHWGYQNQSFGEFSTGIYLRLYNPWSTRFFPSVAFGDGVSVTTQIPKYEVKYGTGNDKHPMESEVLNFLFVDIEVGRYENVSLFYRVHHRCTVFGSIGSDVPGGINFHSIGLRYDF